MKYIVLLLTFIVSSSLYAQKLFDIKNAPAPLYRCPIYDGSTDPSLQWNEEEQEWWMLYTQRRANVEHLEGVANVYGGGIGIAASKDGGRSWYYRGLANIECPDGGHNTYWAPDIFKHKKHYYMVVTFIPGVYSFWGGKCRLRFYKSKDMIDWKLVEEIEDTEYSIDASVMQLEDGSWKMWYKSPQSKSYTATCKNLKNWKLTGDCEIGDVGHEGPVPFFWKGKYWCIIDECNLGYVGLHVYESDDAKIWKRNATILDTPGKRRDDQDQGRHCDVQVVDNRAFIIYFTHPGRVYDKKGVEVYENSWDYHRASIQIAELELVDGKVKCDRDRYAK